MLCEARVRPVSFTLFSILIRFVGGAKRKAQKMAFELLAGHVAKRTIFQANSKY